MSKIDSLHGLLLEELKDLYHAEQQQTAALPRMIDAATDSTLKASLAEHLEQTHGQIKRLERVFELLDATPKTKKCKAMDGLIKEADDSVSENYTPQVRDAALICAVQKMEHYELASYGTVRTFAELLGHEEAARLLQEILDEENTADVTLSELSNSVNPRAQIAVGAD